MKKVKKAVPSKDAFSDLNNEEIVETFYEKKERQKTKKIEFRVEKLSRKKGSLYVKCKSYDNSFKSWIKMTEKV